MTINKKLIWIYCKAALVAAVNVLYYNNRIMATVFIFAQIAVLIADIFLNRMIDYFGNYILFCGLSLEFSNLTADNVIYGFKEFRIAGINMGVLALVPVVLILFFMKTKINKTENKSLLNFSKNYLYIIVISAIMGLIVIAFNDNNAALVNSDGVYIEQLYKRGLQPLLMIVSFLLICSIYNEQTARLSDYLEGTMIGVVCSLLVSLLSGVGGRYGGVDTLLTGVNIRWLPLVMLFPLYKRYKEKKFLFVMAAIGAVLTLMYNATGKTLIVYAVIPVIYCIYYFLQKNYKKAFIWLIIVPSFVLIAAFISDYLSSVSILFKSKYNQVQSLLSLFNGNNGVNQVSESPKIRIYEIINIVKEYIEKPYMLPFGKGLAGTILRRDMEYYIGSYSMNEWATGIIYGVHESFSKLFLSNGILGLWFLFDTVIYGIKNMIKSPWILIGVYWFALSFGYSITMTAFGLSALLYGMYECDCEVKMS